MRTMMTAAALALLMTAAHAGDYLEIGDQFRLTDGTVLTIAKMKFHGDVDKIRVCMKGGKSQCVWQLMPTQNSDGQWITYGGNPQSASADYEPADRVTGRQSR